LSSNDIVFGQRGGKTQKAIQESYEKLMADKTATLYVSSEFLLREFIRLFPDLSGRVCLMEKKCLNHIQMKIQANK